MTIDKIHTDDSEPYGHKTCECATCGFTAVCTPSYDFYTRAEEPAPRKLYCERCIALGANLAIALFAEVERLLATKHTGTDLYKQAVANVLRIPIDDVTDKQRTICKRASFGARYGMRLR